MAQFPVDGRAFRGALPQVPGLRPVADMRAEETRKLYTYNMCHAALAYLGALRGYDLTVDCLADPAIRVEVEGALDEVSRALQAAYGFPAGEMARWNAGVLQQTDNPTLGDRVARHGADPRRKLKRGDRLVGPALLARAHGVRPIHLTRAIAAAFHFRNSADAGAAYVQARVAAIGLPAAIRELCELTTDEEEIVEMVVEADRAVGSVKQNGVLRFEETLHGHGLLLQLAPKALYRTGKPDVHFVERIPLKDVRVVTHLAGLVAREEVSRGHGVALLEVCQVCAQTCQLRLIFCTWCSRSLRTVRSTTSSVYPWV